jgi:transposase-like protein
MKNNLNSWRKVCKLLCVIKDLRKGGWCRVHKEIKWRYRFNGAFPNDSSLLRIMGSILMDINEGSGSQVDVIYPMWVRYLLGNMG